VGNTPLPAFDGETMLFADYGESLRGYVRYQLTQRNLKPFLPKKPQHILDIGGGSGPDAAWLASLGHSITLIEPSDEQRDYAERRFNFFLNDKERARIIVRPGSIADLPIDTLLFDMVLLHGVAMFQPKPADLIRSAATHLKQGGLMSVIEKGYFGAIARAIREQNDDNVRMLVSSGRSINHLQQDVFSWRPADLEAFIKSLQLDVLQWTGIRVITDEVDVKVSDIEAKELAGILAAEDEQSREPTIRGQGQLLHFIARKPKKAS
jgi:S-adenosylmethionine-dependent methyltransferase